MHAFIPFTSRSSSEFEPPRLAKIEFFLLHTIVLPGTSDPCSNLLACVAWPMTHPNHGKPVEVWCNSIYEPEIVNMFCFASTISSCAIVYFDIVDNERVCIAIPIVE